MIIEILVHSLTPSFIRPYSLAPRFCPQYVAIVTPKVIAGCITSCNAFDAAVYEAITIDPNTFKAP